MTDQKKVKNIRDNVIAGLQLAFEKLLKEKQLRDEEFVFSHEGEIYKVKARDFEFNSK